MTALTVNLKPFVATDEEFYELCAKNPELRFERSAQGEVTIMAPAGSETGARNAGIVAQLWNWNQQTYSGLVFDSSAGFRLPNGAIRSPDASWVAQERWQALSAEQQQRFAPLCPDFVVELRSHSDELEPLQSKMQEYMANGAQLGWLIDPHNGRVEVYRPDLTVEVMNDPQSLADEPILPGFHLNLERILR